MKIIKDIVLGEMTYNHGWVKREKLKFWDEIIDFKIKVVTYDEKIGMKSQREDYEYLISNIDKISEETFLSVKKYIEIPCRYACDLFFRHYKPTFPILK